MAVAVFPPWRRKDALTGYISSREPAIGQASKEYFQKQLAQGVDPSQKRQDDKAAALMAQENSFQVIAEEWLSRQTDKAESTRKKSQWLLSFAIADFGSRPVNEVTPPMVLATCRKLEHQGKLETAKRIQVKCRQVFRYAVATGRTDRDPTADLRGGLKPLEVRHRAAIIDPKRGGQLMLDIDQYSGTIVVRSALQLVALVFVRLGELCAARWADIDLEAAEWRYTPPKTRNQTQVALIVPLPTQAVLILHALQQITGQSEHVFHSYGKEGHLSEGAVLGALRRMGYSGDEMTGHGLRAMAKTILLEVFKERDEYIELQLGHRVRDPNGGAYNRVKYLEDRKVMMQTWADYLDTLRAVARGENVVAPNFNKIA
ncbi:MAG: integrase [Halioglobus sp.]|jgi:integrase